MNITPELLTEILHYNPCDGKLTWKSRGPHLFSNPCTMNTWNSAFSGSETFKQIGKNGYHYGVIYRKKYYAHRVAWTVYSGSWPSGQIDHIDGDKLNNRIENLRDVTNTDNQRNTKTSKNNTSGVIGVYYSKSSGKWHARIGVNGLSVNLGYFSDINDAKEARIQAEIKHGYHENHGRK